MNLAGPVECRDSHGKVVTLPVCSQYTPHHCEAASILILLPAVASEAILKSS